MNLESEQDVYARLLTRTEPKRGYPLWVPEPSTQLPHDYRRDGYRIGDVGVITEHGSFDVFFNICLPSSHPLHSPYGVPEGFKQIRLSDQDIESFEHFDKRGCVVSTGSITQTNLAFGGSTSEVSPIVQGSLTNLQFNSSATEGAILVLPEGSDRHNLRNYSVFRNEALRNGNAWYEFGVNTLGRSMISPDSMYLITGFHKTSTWSLAAFNNADRSLNFDVQFTAGDNRNVTAAYTWQTTSSVPYRVGPDPFDGKKNQTVFIRGFKIATRKNLQVGHICGDGDVTVSYQSPRPILGKAHFECGMKGLLGIEREDVGQTFEADDAIVGEHEQNPPSTPPPSELLDPGVHEDCSFTDLSLDHVPFVSKIYHPSDLINQIILDKEPSCDIAVTHDDLWTDIFEELPSGKVDPVDISEAIKCECSKYSIESFLGAAYFSCRSNTKPGLDRDGQKQFSNCSAESSEKTQTSGGSEIESTPNPFFDNKALHQAPQQPAHMAPPGPPSVAHHIYEG